MAQSFVSILLLPTLLVMSHFGLHIPNPTPADPAADEARFNTVNEQLDMGGTLYAYVSVDGDLSGIGEFIQGKVNEVRELDPRAKIPPVDIPQVLQISGLDAVHALGISSKRIDDGFRNKAYIYAPNTRQGLLKLFGDESKPFDVVKMAPAGTDVAIEQDLNLKVAYEVAEELMGMLNGDQGKAMLQAMVKRPAGPFPFTLEKILADLDTQVTLILDADPSWKVQLPGPKVTEIPQINCGLVIDGLGWVVDEMATTLEKELKGKSAPVAIIRGTDWAGFQLEEAPQARKRDKMWIALLASLGGSKPVLLHHKPSGKLVVASGRDFATKMFQEKPNLASDLIYQRTMAGLPNEGTSMAYVSPELFKISREVFSKFISNEGMGGKEAFMVNTMLNLIFPEGLRGEGIVTTSTKEGILTVSNSSNSHKGKLAGPLMGVLPTILMTPRQLKPRKVYHLDEPHHHEHDHHDHAHDDHGHAEEHPEAQRGKKPGRDRSDDHAEETAPIKKGKGKK